MPHAAADKVVYLMRGLPCTGKSYAARKLAGEHGIVCETDEYFYTHVGADRHRYDYDADLLEEARRWNFQRFTAAVSEGVGVIVVDRGNGLSEATAAYARYAVAHGYRIELAEPQSPWWKAIRPLLADKQKNKDQLDRWAQRLHQISKGIHRVPLATIHRWIRNWRPDVTVDRILAYRPNRKRR